MSYEGYDVIYCANGHRIGIYDAYDDQRPTTCAICGDTSFILDVVDQTNGEGEERITEKDIQKYDALNCPICKGLGYTDTKEHQVKNCCTNPTCNKCYGTGQEYYLVDYGTNLESCETCNGRGKIFAEVYNLSNLK